MKLLYMLIAALIGIDLAIMTVLLLVHYDVIGPVTLP